MSVAPALCRLPNEGCSLGGASKTDLPAKETYPFSNGACFITALPAISFSAHAAVSLCHCNLTVCALVRGVGMRAIGLLASRCAERPSKRALSR